MSEPKQAPELQNKDYASEYVGGGYSYYDNRRWLGLGDPLQIYLSSEEIERARRDDEVSSSVEFLIDSIFSDGLQIVAAIHADDPQIEKAQEIADFCARAIEAAPNNFLLTLRNQFRAAFYHGLKVGEIVLRYENSDRFDNKLILDRVNLKPLAATAFVTDEFENVLGLVAAQDARRRSPFKAADLRTEEVIAREKFQILSFEHDDNSPLGLTQIKAAYASFCDKRITRAQYVKWREKNAATQKFLTTPPGAKAGVKTDDNGQPVIVNGKPVITDPTKELVLAAGDMENHSILVAPDGTTCTQMEIFGTGEQFERSFKLNNNAIRKSILGDALATGAADKDARAARQSSMNVVDLRVKSFRTIVGICIKRDLLTLLTKANYEQKFWHLVPDAFLGDTERRDWATDLNAAKGAGYSFAKKHLPELDKQFGVDPRDETDESMQAASKVELKANGEKSNSDGDGRTDTENFNEGDGE